MNKITFFLIFFSFNLFAIDIESIKNDMSVIEKKDISTNIIKAKANSDEKIVDVDTNSKEISFDIPKEAPKSEKPVIDLNNKKLVYFTMMRDVEKNRDEIILTPKKPTKLNQYALTEKTTTSQTSGNLNTSTNSSTKSENQSQRFVGICQFDTTYDIADNLTVNIPCKIDNKIVLLNMTLTPNNKNFELNGVTNFLMIDVYNNATYSKRIYLDSQTSIVKNNVNTSMNIATYYDSRKIEKILGITAKEMSKSLADGTKETFDDFREYNRNEQVSYDQNGNVIVTTSTQKPDLATNLGYSLVEGVFRVVEKGVEMVNVESLPSLYQIVKGSIINIEVYSKGEK